MSATPERDLSSQLAANGSWRTSVVRDMEAIEQLRADWMRCRASVPRPHIQLHPDWLPIGCPPASAGGPTPAVAAILSGTEVLGIAPFRLLDHRWVCRLAYRELLAFKIRLADLCGEALAAPDVERAHVLLLTALADAGIPFDVLFLESVDKGSRLWQTLLTSPILRRAFWVYVPDPEALHHLVRLPATLERYIDSLSSDKQRRLRRLKRTASDTGSGGIELLRIEHAKQVPRFLRQVEEVSRRSWKVSALGVARRTTEEEVTRLTAYAERGWLRSYVLSRGGTPIAFRICYQCDGVLYLDDTGYDAALRPLQPGNVLLYLMIQDCYESDTPQWIDFGYGDNAHKRLFANESYPEANVYLVKKALRPGAAMAARFAFDASGRVARHALDWLSVRSRVRGWLRPPPKSASVPPSVNDSKPC